MMKKITITLEVSDEVEKTLQNYTEENVRRKTTIAKYLEDSLMLLVQNIVKHRWEAIAKDRDMDSQAREANIKTEELKKEAAKKEKEDAKKAEEEQKKAEVEQEKKAEEENKGEKPAKEATK